MRYGIALAVICLMFSSVPAFSTSIAWDGKTLAGDSQSTLGHRKTLDAIKIAHSNDRHASIALSGNALRAEIVMKFFVTSDEPLSQLELPPPMTEDDGVYILVIYDNGKALFYGGDTKSISVVSAPFVMGTGGDIALGAMLAGKTAVQALEIARDHDIYTGGKIVSVVAPQPDSDSLPADLIEKIKKLQESRK